MANLVTIIINIIFFEINIISIMFALFELIVIYLHFYTFSNVFFMKIIFIIMIKNEK